MKTDILKIKEDLESDRINYSTAFEFIKALPKPWKTSEWHDQRNKILKKYCEQCGDTKNVLVAQHLCHPRKFADIRLALLHDLIENSDWAKEENSKPINVTIDEIVIFKQENSITRLACPNCFHLSFRERKTCHTKFKCYYCNTEFDIPVEINYSELFKKKIELIDINSFLLLSKEENRRNNISQTIYEKNSEKLGKQALLLSIEEHLRYISLNDIVTFCKNCATKMDMHNLLLCYDCKKNYFDFDLYENCYICNHKGLNSINPFVSRIQNYRINNGY